MENSIRKRLDEIIKMENSIATDISKLGNLYIEYLKSDNFDKCREVLRLKRNLELKLTDINLEAITLFEIDKREENKNE